VVAGAVGPVRRVPEVQSRRDRLCRHRVGVQRLGHRLKHERTPPVVRRNRSRDVRGRVLRVLWRTLARGNGRRIATVADGGFWQHWPIQPHRVVRRPLRRRPVPSSRYVATWATSLLRAKTASTPPPLSGQYPCSVVLVCPVWTKLLLQMSSVNNPVFIMLVFAKGDIIMRINVHNPSHHRASDGWC